MGSDFHWSRGQPDGCLLVAVGDVSGKGLKAAMLVSVTIGILRNEKSDSPGAILAALNEGLAGHTGGGFVTCCGARFDPDGRVTLGNAGHPSPYEESIVRGERFTFVSDAAVEAENTQRELFGFDRTREISTKSAQEIADAYQGLGPERRHHRRHCTERVATALTESHDVKESYLVTFQRVASLVYPKY